MDGSATLVDAETAIEADLGILGIQTLAQAALVVTTATSNAAGSAATALIEGTTISTSAGVSAIDVLGSAVTCPTAGSATSDVTPPATVTLDGTTVELDADGETVVTVSTTDPDATVSLTLRIDEQTTTTDTAAATALVLGIEQIVLGVSTTSGTVTLAQTSCEAPLPPPPPPILEPVVESLDPPEGPEAGGTTVTVQGSGFVPGETTVTIGGITIPAEDVQVSADGTSLTFVTPPHTPGQVDVIVTTPGGTSGALTYTYVAAEPPPPVVPPLVESLGPLVGPTTGGTSVAIEGSGFVSGETFVTVGGIVLPPEQVTVSGDGTKLTFTTPPHAAGTIEVTITTPAGTTGPLFFTCLAAAVTPGGGALPATGADTLPLLAIGLALAFSGGLLVALGRGRRTARAR